jgi:hypothetical protein
VDCAQIFKIESSASRHFFSLSLDDAYHARPWNEKPEYLKSIPVSDSRALDRERLKGLYSKLNSLPELMNRRFQVGSKPPQIPVDSYRFEVRDTM